ncbi:hypothetical protein K402DRAFT_405811 [Aulographum hederae CBS 113979]|uniref:Uncharacterized protein n=1 Tax=Aulographum hederae CBS 113979 TaxID=1176131 RepID=A0A6G1GVE0_9PEZI|nr:hypothetical protein K402DRAFT_405811 [Aulographum hederae CBS 113979]
MCGLWKVCANETAREDLGGEDFGSVVWCQTQVERKVAVWVARLFSPFLRNGFAVTEVAVTSRQDSDMRLFETRKSAIVEDGDVKGITIQRRGGRSGGLDRVEAVRFVGRDGQGGERKECLGVGVGVGVPRTQGLFDVQYLSGPGESYWPKGQRMGGLFGEIVGWRSGWGLE